MSFQASPSHLNISKQNDLADFFKRSNIITEVRCIKQVFIPLFEQIFDMTSGDALATRGCIVTILIDSRHHFYYCNQSGGPCTHSYLALLVTYIPIGQPLVLSFSFIHGNDIINRQFVLKRDATETDPTLAVRLMERFYCKTKLIIDMTTKVIER